MNSNKPTADPLCCQKLVSIGVPIYKRLNYLPGVLKMVGSQDYPLVELIVSDNGENGSKVREIVEAQYLRPYRFRQNSSTVNMIPHFNQIIHEASGEYFALLNDDDEISPNFVSELVQQMERHPEATLAYASQEIINAAGEVVAKSKENLPVMLSGPDFIRAMWQRGDLGLQNVESFLTKTNLLKETGGYPDFTKGNHTDNAAAIRLCLNDYVVFGSKCIYRHRVYEGGYGWQVSIEELAAACREFMHFLDADPSLLRFSAAHPGEWQDLKRCLVQMSWETYLWRWKDIYRQRISGVQWVKAAFAMPFLPDYYRRIARVFLAAAKAQVKRLLVHSKGSSRDFFKRPPLEVTNGVKTSPSRCP